MDCGWTYLVKLQTFTCANNEKIATLREEACSTQNCSADCLTKASAKADILITAVKTVRLLDVDIHQNFRTLMEHKDFLSTWRRTCMHTRENDVFLPECFEDSHTNSTKRTIPCDVCENSHVFRESRCYENNVCTRRLTNLFLFDDDVTLGENIVFVLGSRDPFSLCFTFLSQLCDRLFIKTDWCWQSEQMDDEFC